jgi:hypothetical protein
MYAAKAAGKGRLAVFEPSMRVRAWSRLEAEADLRSGHPRPAGSSEPDALSEAS